MQHSLTLYHIDPARNMQRYYRLDIQPDLFGNQCPIVNGGESDDRARFAVFPILLEMKPRRLSINSREQKREEDTVSISIRFAVAAFSAILVSTYPLVDIWAYFTKPRDIVSLMECLNLEIALVSTTPLIKNLGTDFNDKEIFIIWKIVEVFNDQHGRSLRSGI